MWDDLQLQLAAEVLQHLQLLRSRVSSWSSAHVQFLDETKVAQQQWKHSKVGQQELCLWCCCCCTCSCSDVRRFCVGRWSMSCSHWVVVVRFDLSNVVVVVFNFHFPSLILHSVVCVRCDVCVHFA